MILSVAKSQKGMFDVPGVPIFIQSTHLFHVSFQGSGVGWHIIRHEKNHIEKLASSENIIYCRAMSEFTQLGHV